MKLAEVSPVSFPALPEPEPYLSREQLAERMGVSVATIDRMRAAGMPSECWGRRTRRFTASTAIAWARAQGLHDGGSSAP